jgi:N utilization substance protein B
VAEPALNDSIHLVRSRRAAREATFQALYLMEVGRESADKAVRDILEFTPFAHEAVEQIKAVVYGVYLQSHKIDKELAKFLASGWSWERIAVTDKCALRLAAYELLHVETIPPKVSIHEAVLLARKFGAEESGRFVNGLLGQFLLSTPKAKWVAPASSEEVEEFVPDIPEVIEEEIVQEGSEKHEEMMKAGAWSLKKAAKHADGSNDS